MGVASIGVANRGAIAGHSEAVRFGFLGGRVQLWCNVFGLIAFAGFRSRGLYIHEHVHESSVGS